MESCSDSDRLDNSIRGQQCVANAAARQLGFPDACVSKSTVYRHREKTRLNSYSSSYNEINKQDSLQLGFDGKEVNGKERYIFNIIYEAANNNRMDRLLDVKTFPESVKSADIYNHVRNIDETILSKVLCLVADTTAVNTGCKMGAFKRIQGYIISKQGIEIHTLECLVHIIELLFRHFFCYVEGPSKSPDKFPKDAVYNLIGSINNTVENMSVQDNFSIITCPDISKKIIKRIVDSIQSGEIELQDDRACFFAYTAIVIGLDIPMNLKRFLSYK